MSNFIHWLNTPMTVVWKTDPVAVFLNIALLVVFALNYFLLWRENRMYNKVLSKTVRQRDTLKHWIGLDRCGDCFKCEDEIDTDCPFAGEPNGCNNRDCADCVKSHEGETWN